MEKLRHGHVFLKVISPFSLVKIQIQPKKTIKQSGRGNCLDKLQHSAVNRDALGRYLQVLHGAKDVSDR